MQFEFNPMDCRFMVRHASQNLHFIGPSESSASSSQQSSNEQVTTGNAAPGSSQFSAGANSTVTETGAGGVTADNSTVNLTSIDPQLLATLGNTMATVSDNAIISGYNTTLAALGFGSETVTANTNLARDTIHTALGFGSEALNTLGIISSAGQQEAQASVMSANDTTAYLASQLAQITANAAPQTAAAQSEILAGTSPTTRISSLIPSSDMGKVALVAGAIGVVYLLRK